MTLLWAGCTVRGVRSNNEDAFLAGGQVYAHDTESVLGSGELGMGETEWQVFAVSDGMGGHDAGEEASRWALGRLEAAWKSLTSDAGEDAVRSLLVELHRELLAHGAAQGKPTMGCTLTGVALGKTRSWLFNIGDSRVYTLDNGYLRPLTKDHSLRELVGNPDMAQNQLYSCLGGGAQEVTVDVVDLTARARGGRVFLLTSDGYHEFLDYDKLEGMLAQPPESWALDAEALAAVDRGSQDNATLLALLVKET